MDLPAKGDQHTQAPSRGTRGQPNGVREVAWTIGAGIGGKSHRTGEDDCAEVRVISDDQIGEEGGLFQGVGAVSDNDSFNLGPKTPAHLVGDAEHVRGLQGRAGYSFE